MNRFTTMSKRYFPFLINDRMIHGETADVIDTSFTRNI